MTDTLRPAVVSTVTPLAVVLKRATVATPVNFALVTVPALVVGDRVMVALVEGRVFFVGKWVAL